MSITPQAIKDQEFQVKFRGYDAVEVKAYLELLAEEFFELHELKRKQEDEYADLYQENQALQREKDTLMQTAQLSEESSEETLREQRKKDDRISELQRKLTELETVIGKLEQENTTQLAAWEAKEQELADEIASFKDRLQAKQEAVSRANNDADKLRHQVEMLEQQISELKKDEVDFKSTIIAAQKFADDLRTRSEVEASEMMEKARSEVDTFRREAEDELARLPLEIEELSRKRAQVCEDLRAVLNTYLEQLNTFTEATESGDDEDLSDLFQSITLPEDGTLDPDELDKINMDLS